MNWSMSPEAQQSLTDYASSKKEIFEQLYGPIKQLKPFVTERFKLPQAVVDEIQSMTPDFGHGQFSEAVFYRTYSRVKNEKTGEMESWNDVIIRVTEGVFSIRKDWYIKNTIKWDDDFWSTYARGFAISMFRMQWLPPGRGLWAMGSEFVYERGSMALNNCGAISVGDNIGECCDWIMDALMCGVGVGYEPVRNDDQEFYYPTKSHVHIIEDTREAWVASIREQIESYCSPNMSKPYFKYHKIRRAGLPIRGFGGISSGPEPLIKLHKRIDIFFDMFFEQDWYDTVLLKSDIVNCIAACVVAGNVRRSALICLGSIEDQVFLDLKNYAKYPYRSAWGGYSNNSATLDCSEHYEKLGEISTRVRLNGEPGIVNVQNMKYARIGKPMGGLRDDKATKFNPCHPSSAWIITKTGMTRLGDLRIGEEIWSETGWTTVINKWSTGLKDVYRWHTTTGHIDLTEDHLVVCKGEKIEIGLTDSIDRLNGPTFPPMVLNEYDIMDGLVQGDGCYTGNKITLCIGERDHSYFNSEVAQLIKMKESDNYLYNVDTTHSTLARTFDRTIPEKFLNGSPAKVMGFLRGLFSANGSFVGGRRITLKAASKSVIISVSKMLSSLGIATYYTTNAENDVEFSNGTYTCKESYDLNISRQADVRYFMKIIGFIQPYKNNVVNKALDELAKNPSSLKMRATQDRYDITKEEYLGIEEVFDITVDNSTHTFWCDGFNVSNCGEQPLEDGELCTLAETLPTRCDTINEWYKACEYATVYASTVTLLPTHRHNTNAIIAKNRRIGIGIVDFSGWKHQIGLNKVIKHLRKGYDLVRSINHWVQSEAGVPDSIRVTTVKPGGTIPKLAGRTAGLGHPNFHHQIRRMRVAVDSPVATLLIDAGVPHELDVVSDGTWVFEFPLIQGPAKPAAEVSLWEQAANLVVMQREWSDNAVSNTLTFVPEWECINVKDLKDFSSKDIDDLKGQEFKTAVYDGKVVISVRNSNHEEDDIEHVLAAHAPSIKSISLLPASNKGVFAQMPEEGISPEEYDVRLAKIKPIDWTRLRHSVAEPEKYCTGEACELPVK